MNPITKDPDGVLDYQFNWGDWLPTGDTITTATIGVSDPGLVVDSQQETSTAVTVWLSAGIAKETYKLTCHIITAAGREDDRTITVKVNER